MSHVFVPHSGEPLEGAAPGPVRTCVGCRGRGPRSELVRLALGAEDVTTGAARPLVVDVARSLPGRGAWLHPRVRCLELAERRHAFPRALRHSGALDASDLRRYLEALEPAGAPPVGRG